MPFPAFWCAFLCMEQVTNEKKILRILVKQNMNRKIARLLSKNCPGPLNWGEAAAPPLRTPMWAIKKPRKMKRASCEVLLR